MSKPTEKDPERPKRIKDSIEETAYYCDERKKFHGAKAEEFGYAGDAFKHLGKQIENIKDNPSLGHAESVVNKFKDFLKEQEKRTEHQMYDVSSGAFATATSVATTFYISDILCYPHSLIDIKLPEPPPTWSPKRAKEYAERLGKLNPELGDLMRSVSECFYGKAHEAERTALVSMRQLIDHFFEILAPDEEVRKSNYFTRKTGERPEQVYRKERVIFAANNKIQDAKLAETLIAESDALINSYDQLNKLHKRGPLDHQKIFYLLSSVQAIMEQWIDALRL